MLGRNRRGGSAFDFHGLFMKLQSFHSSKFASPWMLKQSNDCSQMTTADIARTTPCIKGLRETKAIWTFSWLQCQAFNQNFKGHSSQWHTVASKVGSTFFPASAWLFRKLLIFSIYLCPFFFRALLILGYCSLSGEKLTSRVNKLLKMKNSLGTMENNLLPPSAFLFTFCFFTSCLIYSRCRKPWLWTF